MLASLALCVAADAPRPSIAIIACVKSTAHTPTLNSTALARVLVPSLNATISEAERSEWDIRLYLCADADDALYRGAVDSGELESFAPPWLDVRAHFYTGKRGRIPSREAAAQAVADGCDYLHRTNDDIEYQKRGGVGWLTGATGALRSLSPPNVGVVGAKVWGDGLRYRGGFTIDLVHRTHLAIFGEYYPPQLDNWFVDDWITYAYVPWHKSRDEDRAHSSAHVGHWRAPWWGILARNLRD